MVLQQIPDRVEVDSITEVVVDGVSGYNEATYVRIRCYMPFLETKALLSAQRNRVLST